MILINFGASIIMKSNNLARTITHNSKERLVILRGLTLGEQSAIFAELSQHVQQSLLTQLSVTEIVDILDHMDLQLAEKVLTRIKDNTRRNKITKRLKTEIREKIEYFLRFHPKASLALIHFNYLFLPADITIAEAGEAIDSHYQDTGKFPEILVHQQGNLLGEVPVPVLVRESSDKIIGNFVQTVQTISYQAEISEVVNVLATSGRKKLVVLDHDESVLGIIYADDALDLFGKLPGESLYSFSGLDSTERPFDSVLTKVKKRYRWLILNLATAFLAGSIILIFQDTVNALTIIAVYIPIVTGMGGNASSQTFAVILRGITLGTISLKNGLPAISKEVLAGLINGTIIGLIVTLISLGAGSGMRLGITVGLSMVIVHIVAGLFGAFVPLLMKLIGRDPAATSMIFISTATDVFGMLALLGIGALLLL